MIGIPSLPVSLIESFLQICIKPLRDLLKPPDPMLRLFASGKLMILPMEEAKSGGTAVHSEIGEHLDRIAHPTRFLKLLLFGGA